MKRLIMAIAPVVLAHSAPPQAPANVAAFRAGLEVSVEGNGWGRSRTLTLDAAHCRPMNESPCAPGTPSVIVNLRFPALPAAIDVSRVLATFGETASPGNHYMVRPVPANASATVCAQGFVVPAPFAKMRLAIRLSDKGTPLPITCRWAVVAGIPDALAPAGIAVLWSDTVVVKVEAKR